MGLYSLSPEVAGGWGPNTTVANRAELESGEERVPRITHLEYQFDDWLGDDLIESFPCFLVTKVLAADLENEGVSGIGFEPVEVSVSGIFQDIHPAGLKLPTFLRLVPAGEVAVNAAGSVVHWSGQDVCLMEPARLVVTDKCLVVLRKHHFAHCEASELPIADMPVT